MVRLTLVLAVVVTLVTAAHGQARDIGIPSDPGIVLAATLRMPDGPEDGTRMVPVVVIQGGAGPTTRGAFPGLQDRLLQAGIATLEFDKRGVGASTDPFTDTMETMEADLLAAIAWLRRQAEIDGARIALLGHSQGAAAAPDVAQRDGGLAALVFLSSPVGGRGAMILDGMRIELRQAGRTVDQADAVAAAAGNWLDAKAKPAPAAQIASARAHLVDRFAAAGFAPVDAMGAVASLDTPQFLSMYAVETEAPLADLHIPVLALFGGNDEHVTREYGAVRAVAALAANPQALVVEVPGAGHNYTARAADAPARTNPPGGRWLFPEALVADWLTRQLGVRPEG